MHTHEIVDEIKIICMNVKDVSLLWEFSGSYLQHCVSTLCLTRFSKGSFVTPVEEIRSSDSRKAILVSKIAFGTDSILEKNLGSKRVFVPTKFSEEPLRGFRWALHALPNSQRSSFARYHIIGGAASRL